ncbi:MAG: helix-turn-helix transcriptional regulator [Pseudooceanicola sp.]
MISSARWRAALAEVADVEGMQDFVAAARDGMRLDHLFYHWVNAPGGQTGAGTYPVEWQVRYLERDYVRVDPVIAACARVFDPVNWKSLDWSQPKLRMFLADSTVYGVSQQGYSIPLHGPNGEFAIFTVNHDMGDADWLRFCASNRDELTLLGRAVHARGRAILAAEDDATGALTQRESEVISLLATGLSRLNAARELDISEHTLRDYLTSARRKLAAQNTTHAVARAISTGKIVL